MRTQNVDSQTLTPTYIQAATAVATKSASITTTQNNHLYVDAPAFDYIRCYYTMTSGQLAVTQQTTVKE